MRKKRIRAVLIALVVAVSIPSGAFAATIGGTEVITEQNQLVTGQGSNDLIRATGNSAGAQEATTTVIQTGSGEEKGSIIKNGDSVGQEKDLAKDESGNLPDTEKPVVEEPVVTEPPVVVEEPVATEPAIVVEEPVATEPAIVVEEPVVTEAAIIVEPVPATLTITYRLTVGDRHADEIRIIDGLEVGQVVDLTKYLAPMDWAECVTQDTKFSLDEEQNAVILQYVVKLDADVSVTINDDGKTVIVRKDKDSANDTSNNNDYVEEDKMSE